MRRKSIISISLFLALTLVSPGIADDKAVGRNYNPNPSQIMKQYHMKAVAPLTADSVEAILIGECKDNIPLQEKSGDWGQLGFTIRENQNDQANFLKSNSVVNSDDPNVIKLVNQLKGRTPLETSQNILKWVDDNIAFEFYLNTKKGGAEVLQTKKGNGCDQSHLIISLLRAAEIPARYAHCKDGVYLSGIAKGERTGHVWPEANIGGKWLSLDNTSRDNTVGVIKNYKKLSSVIYYDKLPF